MAMIIWLLFVYFFEDDFLGADFLGTFAPSFLASDRPIAIACFLLVTFLPLPDLSAPSCNSCMAFSTFSPAFFPYRAMVVLAHLELPGDLKAVAVHDVDRREDLSREERAGLRHRCTFLGDGVPQ